MDCTFCGKDIKKGTGIMYIKKEGKVFHFCSSKCEKNLLKLKRVPRYATWTKSYADEKVAQKRGAVAKVAPAAKVGGKK